jgi:WD40 repeat protein
VRVWDLETGELAQTLAHDQDISALTFSPDGETLATASREGLVTLWVPTIGRSTLRLERSIRDVVQLRFVEEGRALAAISSDGRVRYWRSAPETDVYRYFQLRAEGKPPGDPAIAEFARAAWAYALHLERAGDPERAARLRDEARERLGKRKTP